MGYLQRLLGLEGKRAVQAVTDRLTELDPTTASQAQLQEMEADLDKTGKLLARLRAEAIREHNEAEAAQRVFDQHVAAAEKLHADLKASTDDVRKLSLNTSLGSLLDRMTRLKPELDREVAEANDADQLLHEAEEAYQEKALGLRTAKGNLTNAQRDMERAKIRQEQAAQRAERAAEIAGLREGGSNSSLNAALNSMQRKTAALNEDAESKRLKVDALKRPLLGGEDDPNIMAALASVSRPVLPSSSEDIDSRLAALTGRAPQQALPAPQESNPSAAPTT